MYCAVKYIRYYTINVLYYPRYPEFIAPCLGIHPIQQLSPDQSVTIADLDGVEEVIRANQHRLFAIGEVHIYLFHFGDCPLN